MSDTNFTFRKLNSSTSSVSGMVNPLISVLEIPSVDVSGFPVTEIDSNAFKGNKFIEEVKIPNSVKIIGDAAFENCSNLKKLVLPDSMNEIGRHAFKRCNILLLTLPELNELGFAAFSKNTNGIFYINNKIKYVKSHAFNECKTVVCQLSGRDTIKWDDDWSAGAKSFSNIKEDIPPMAPNDSVINAMSQTGASLMDESRNEATNKQELFDQNLETNDIKGIVYAKVAKLSFPVRHLLISKIPVLQSAHLSFYQKFIILLLEKGVRAINRNELIDSLSNTLNVSRFCVEDFVNYLVQGSYLDYDDESKKYSLCKEMHFVIRPDFDNAMFAELDTKLAECNNIVYIKKINKCYLEDDFNNGVFRRKGDSSDKDSYLGYDDIKEIKSQSEYIKGLLSKYFEKTNMHLKGNAAFDINSGKSSDYQIEFDALLQYSYSKEEKISTLFNVAVLKNNFLPKDFIYGLASKYKKDKELPRFLGMQEQFYDKVAESTLEIDKTELSIESANEKVKPLQEDLINSKITLNELRKVNKQKRKEAYDAADEVKSKIIEKENEISTNVALINESTVVDENLVNNLKKTINSLKKDKEKLEDELLKKTNYVEELEGSLEKSEESISRVIDEKEKTVSKAKAVVKEHEAELKKHEKTLTSLLISNKNKTNTVIQNVIKKYPAGKNIFNRYVTDIVIHLDSAISASESNAVNEIARCIDTIREMYRKVIQIVFDTLLGKREMSLGSYMGDPFNQLELEKLFKARGVNIDVKQRLITFHEIANAIGHLAENGPKKAGNEKRLDQFKKMNLEERNRILLAIPDFFNSINFANKEVDSFVNKLTIK